MEKGDKQINALLYAVKKYPKIGRTKLMKFVFLVDFLWYNDNDETLLEDNYIRMPNGPVPSLAYSVTDYNNEYFSVEIVDYDPQYREYRFKGQKTPNLNSFDKETVKLFDYVIDLLKNSNAKTVSEFTHQLSPWKKTKNGSKIPIELFKLTEYEVAEIEASNRYNNAKKLTESIDDTEKGDGWGDFFELPDGPLDKDLMNLQFVNREVN